jgi:hypothetical protein
MQEPKENKKIEPKSNKQVKIKFRPGRAAEGVVADANGYATVDAKLADYLVKIQYADMAEEKEQ